MFSFGPAQIFLLVLVVLLLFGKKIPETMRSLGVGVNEFKRGLEGSNDPNKEEKSAESEKKETSDTEA